jgi:hypothetical protein
MKWEDVRRAYPEQWILIEAVDAYSEGEKRIVEELTIVEAFGDDNEEALRNYLRLHRAHKERELYVIHTSRPEIDIREKRWIGVRRN